ncbi:MAG: Zn-ribbon domain-containing OB-fold protein [Actinobacteria bacterium]|nr:Zn-ribbon domain-containing OB-fold protein [Actinomycetota bacterium]
MSDATTGATTTGTAKQHLVMEHLVSLTYRDALPPSLDRFVDRLLEGHIVGHRCPSCSRVYVPPRGYCPMCVVPTAADHEVEVSDRGILTGFTVITPIAYYGQQETEPFVHASVRLDGADTTLVGVEITGVPHDELRMGLRVKAVWKPESERSTEGISSRGWGGVSSVIDSFEPTGEPDAPPDEYRDHVF